MNFKPGDKVWVTNGPGGYYPAGDYAAVLIAYCGDHARPPNNDNAPLGGWWTADIEGIQPVNGTYPFAHESKMRPRYDPPDWVKLCKLDEVRPSVPRELV